MKIPVHIIIEKRRREEEVRRHREEQNRLPIMPPKGYDDESPKREKERALNKIIVIEL